jgi:hypothetical protein
MKTKKQKLYVYAAMSTINGVIYGLFRTRQKASKYIAGSCNLYIKRFEVE